MSSLLRYGGAVNRTMSWTDTTRRPATTPWNGQDDGPSTVVVIDGDISVRELLEPTVRAAGWAFEGFTSAEEFLARPRRSVPCCVIVDLDLPGLSGLELQKHLAERQDTPLIFMTSHADVLMTVQAMKAGAVDFLLKPANEIALMPAIRAALERSRAVLRHDSDVRRLGICYASLTPREREVMALVVAGLLNKQIGAELGISEITVKAHRGQVMRKMGADSLPHLVTIAAEFGLRHTLSPRRARTVRWGGAVTMTDAGRRHHHQPDRKELR